MPNHLCCFNKKCKNAIGWMKNLTSGNENGKIQANTIVMYTQLLAAKQKSHPRATWMKCHRKVRQI